MSKKSSNFAPQNCFDMRKYVLLSLLALMLAGMTSCEKNEGPQMQKSIYLTVNQDEWQYDKTLGQFYAHFTLPDITAKAYDYGNYSLYRVYKMHTPDEYQVALPETVYLVEMMTDTITGEEYEYYYQQHVNYRIGIGYVELQVTNSDYWYSEENPERMDFHLQLVY